MDGGGSYRKQWHKGGVSPPQIARESKTPRAMYEGPDKYDEYLIQLQQKNRLLKQLKAKDDKQIALEKKEKGFSLYVNGANTGLIGGVKHSPRKPTTMKPKTAGDYPRRALIGQMDMADGPDRARTAPGKVHRKNWTQASVDIKTDQGERLKLKSRLAMAEYSEDFEMYEEDDHEEEEGRNDGENDEEGDDDDGDEEGDDYSQLTRQMTVILEQGSDGDSDIEIDASQYARTSQEGKKTRRRSKKRDEDEDVDEGSEDDDAEINEQLLLSIEDVKTLRRSLEANAQIRRSICRRGTDSDDESSSSDSDIEEGDEEEIEEDIDVQNDSLEGPGSVEKDQGGKTKIEPGDMIVLDFASHVKSSKKELLSAKRKKDAEEVEFPRRETQDDNKRSGAKKRDVVLDAGSPPRKSTTLSAQKKSEDASKKWASGAPDNMAAIQRAIEEENRAASASKEQTRARTAPEDESKVSPIPSDIPQRPQTVILHRGSDNQREDEKEEEEKSSDNEQNRKPGMTSDPSGHDPLLTSQNLDDLKLAMALEKVKEMDSKSQRRLLRVLGQLEESTSPRTPRTASRRKAVGSELGDSDIFMGPKLAPRSKSALSSKSIPLTSSSDLEVILEIRSNWGHPSRVGVTEVQFFDLGGQRINLQPSDMEVKDVCECKGELCSIINGRMKTTKERNMWSCEYQQGSSVSLHFRIPLSSPGEGLSKIRIWNFNKNLKDLSMGIQEARISLGQDVVWEGTVDKGCGNQVFDYSTSIPVSRTKSDDQTNPEKQKEPDKSSKDRGQSENAKGAVGSSQEHARSGYGTKASRCETLAGKMQKPKDSAELRASKKEVFNKSNSNSNGAVDDTDNGEIRKSIAFEIDLDTLPSATSSSLEQRPSPSKSEQTKTSTTKKLSASNQTESASVMKKESAIKASSSPSMKNLNPSISVDPPQHRHPPGKGAESIEFAQQLGLGASASASFDPNQPSQPIRCETRVLMRSTDDLDLPTVDDSIQIFATPRASLDARREKTPLADDDVTPRAVPMVMGVPANKVEDRDESFGDEEPSMMDQLKELAIGPPNNKKPQWLAEDTKKKRPAAKKKLKKPPWLSILDDEAEKSAGATQEEDDSLDNCSPWPGSHRRSSQDILDLDHPMTAKEPTGRRSRNQGTDQLKQAVAVADDLEEMRWRQLAAEGGVSDEEHLSPPGRRGSGAGGQHDKRPHPLRSNQDRSLEESWTSLSMFDKSQAGRLAPNLNLDVEGDALDTILSGRRSRSQEEIRDDSSDEFEIPILPVGKCMTINIKTTWGDRHYVGLNGIEIFQSNGEHVEISKITAEPRDLNILPDYTNDPRVVTNLTDGVNCTRDDIHMWLAPFTPGRMHLITMTFHHPVKVAMIRIWNYNKSRIHSFRGAKDVEVSLDDRFIFKGEISRASGAVQGDPSSFGDTILFTEDEEILELISKNDEVYVAAEEWFSSSLDEDANPPTRPRTADVGEERPMTTARQNRAQKTVSEPIMAARQQEEGARSPPGPPPHGDTSYPASSQPPQAMAAPLWARQQETHLTGRHLKLNFTLTWGDPHYLGLTGLEVMDIEGDGFPMSMTMLDACPRDLNDLPEYDTDDRTLDKLINGVNVTTSDEHMWMIPFCEGGDHFLFVDLGREVQLTGLRIWNYNKSSEDTYRGAKIVHVWLDDRQVSPDEGYLIRKGPGNCFFDYAQDIGFVGHSNWQAAAGRPQRAIPDTLRQSQVAMEMPTQEYVPMHMPCGFVFQFQLLSSWGDQYYIGLNGLEFYDAQGDRMELTESNIAAYPPSVNVLEGVSDDVRTPDKLIDGVNDTTDGRHMWLAPVLPGVMNRVYVIFDEPATVSMIKLWNYSKTPNRGVKEFGLLVDDLLVYNGILGQVTTAARGILPSLDVPTPYHTILFADNAEIRKRERHTILQNQQQEQDVQMTDDRQVMAHFKNPKKLAKTVDQALRPKTSVPAQGVPRRR